MILRVLLLLALFSSACRGQERAAPDLRAAVDSLLPRLETLSGLEAREEVRVARQSREAMRAYVEEQLEKELPPEELAGMQAAYAAWGLIPDTLDLKRLLLDLYTEQVVGYYDPETEALYLIEGAPVQQLQPILAHELVHALQDQHVDLDSLISRERGNDRQLAAQAAVEGHATLVMFLLLVEQQAGRPLDFRHLPDMSAQLEPLVEAQNEQFPVFRSAPRIIRETLLFPYVGGAAFVQALWSHAAPPPTPGAAPGRGGDAPAGELPAPIGPFLPSSTEQVLRPRERFLERRDAPTELELAETPAPWRTAYENTLGQLETSILLEEHLGPGADSLAVGWDGDRFRLLEAAGGGHALVWYTVWDSAPAADAFAGAYRRILEQRAGRHGRVERLELQGRPAVLVVDAARGVAVDQVVVPGVARLTEQ